MDKYKKAIVEHEICRTELVRLTKAGLTSTSYEQHEQISVDLNEMKQRFGIAKKRIGQLARNLVFIK